MPGIVDSPAATTASSCPAQPPTTAAWRDEMPADPSWLNCCCAWLPSSSWAAQEQLRVSRAAKSKCGSGPGAPPRLEGGMLYAGWSEQALLSRQREQAEGG